MIPPFVLTRKNTLFCFIQVVLCNLKLSEHPQQPRNQHAQIVARGVAGQADDDAAEEYLAVAQCLHDGRHERRRAEQADVAHGEKVALHLEDLADDEVQHNGSEHHEDDEPEDLQRALDGVDIELGGHHHAEDQDEEHAELKCFGQGTHLRTEGSDDGEGGNSQNHNQFVELARDEQRESRADGQHAEREQESEHHAPESLGLQHPLVVLETLRIDVMLRGRTFGLFLGGQQLAEHLIAAGHDKDDERKGGDLLKSQRQGDERRIDLQHVAEGGEVHGATSVDASHHSRHTVELRDAGVPEDEETGDHRDDDGDQTAKKHGHRLRQRLRPELEVRVEEHQRDGQGHRDVHQRLLHRLERLRTGFRTRGQEADQRRDNTHGIRHDDGADTFCPPEPVEYQDDDDRNDEVTNQGKYFNHRRCSFQIRNGKSTIFLFISSPCLLGFLFYAALWPGPHA